MNTSRLDPKKQREIKRHKALQIVWNNHLKIQSVMFSFLSLLAFNISNVIKSPAGAD